MTFVPFDGGLLMKNFMENVKSVLALFLSGAMLCTTVFCDNAGISGKHLNPDVDVTDAVLRADKNIQHQIVREFGVSGCWWSTGIGNRGTLDELLDLCFTERGIALNNYRHHIGAGRDEGPLASDARPNSWRAVPTPLMKDGTMDITADPNSLRILQKINSLGTVDNITLFILSPPACMTVNGKTYGLETGSNLKPDAYDAFAAYCADVAQAYINAGYNIKYIAPFNEPQWQWETAYQEGCHFTPDQLLQLSKMIISELNKRQLPVKISINETAQYRNREYTHLFYQSMMEEPEIYPYVDHFAAHAYDADKNTRTAFFNWTRTVAGKLNQQPLPVYQTEYAAWQQQDNLLTLDDRLMMTARTIHEDLSYLNVESWGYFTLVGYGPNSLVQVSDAPAQYRILNHFWVIGNYSKFIKGYTRIEVEPENIPEEVVGSAYLSPDRKKMVFVVINEDQKKQTMTLKGIPNHSMARVWETTETSTCEKTKGYMTADNGYILPPRSVTTFVFDL